MIVKKISEIKEQKKKLKIFLLILLGIISLIGLYFISRYNYLLFHTAVEIITIVIACSVFILAWNTRKIVKNDYILFLGISFLFVAILDFIHTLAYKGMPIFIGFTANLPTQLWIILRYMNAFSLLLAPFFIKKKLKISCTFLVYSVVSLFLLLSIFYWKIFPNAFIEGSGLTQFKIISEYIISFILLASIYVLYKKRDSFDKKIFYLLIASLVLAIFSELAFTLYTDVYGISNFIGHIFELVEFLLIYVAILHIGLAKPYDLLFKELKDSNKLKGLFIDIMKHDILNPVSVIKMNTQMILMKDEKNPKKKEVLERIYHSSDKTIKLIENAYAFSRLQDEEKINFEKEDIGSIIKKVSEEMSQKTKDREIKIKLNFKGKFFARVNSSLMQDAVTNLLSNAIKYGPEKSEININIKEDISNYQILIADKGKGIPNKYKKAIFDRFNRLEKGAVEGIGLGLAIVKRIIEIHKGKVWVEDNLPKGSIFIVEIPKAKK